MSGYNSLATSGQLKINDQVYFYKDISNASILKIKLASDSLKQTILPTNYIESTFLDYALLELFETKGLNDSKNFDSLPIPFRAVASDIYKKDCYQNHPYLRSLPS